MHRAVDHPSSEFYAKALTHPFPERKPLFHSCVEKDIVAAAHHFSYVQPDRTVQVIDAEVADGSIPFPRSSGVRITAGPQGPPSEKR